jgi:hypothetical protein
MECKWKLVVEKASGKGLGEVQNVKAFLLISTSKPG